MKDPDCAHSATSSFFVEVAVLVAAACLAAGVFVPAALAEPSNPGLNELWEQFPLYGEGDSPRARDGASDGADTNAGRPPAVRPTAVREPDTEGATIGTWARVAIVAAGIALMVGGLVGAAAMLGVRLPRRPPARARPEPAAIPPAEPPPPAPAPAPAPHVVEDLTRLVNAAPRRPSAEEVTMNAERDRPRQATELEALKAKHPKSDAQAEAEVLKRKPAADATEALKAKGEGERALDKERLAAGDAVALKEKLAAAAEEKVALRERVGRARVGVRDTEGRSAPRPVPDAADVEVLSEARARRRSRDGTEECEVRWWRGYVKSQFIAVVTRADGAEATVASSPFFLWHKRALPTESPAAAAALRTLAETLERDGWSVVDLGEQWFSLRFRREIDADRTRPPAADESST